MERRSEKKSIGESVPESSDDPILCANSCGFFGSVATNNLCSKCYKDHLLAHPNEIVVEKKKKIVEEEVIGKAGNSKVEEVTPSEKSDIIQPANRCSFCRKRVGLTGFKCRCGHTFCSIHRYSDKHNCVFDYKGAGQDAIAKANPIVKADKIDKI